MEIFNKIQRHRDAMLLVNECVPYNHDVYIWHERALQRAVHQLFDGGFVTDKMNDVLERDLIDWLYENDPGADPRVWLKETIRGLQDTLEFGNAYRAEQE